MSFRLQGAVKDNDFIYHEVVPELDALPEIKGMLTLFPFKLVILIFVTIKGCFYEAHFAQEFRIYTECMFSWTCRYLLLLKLEVRKM